MTVLILLGFDDIGLNHFVVKIIALARAFAHAGKHRNAAMQLRDVIDQLHNDHRLAHAGAAERADLAALEEWANQIDDLNARGEHLLGSGLFGKRRCRAVNGIVAIRFDRPLLVHGLAGDIEHAAHHSLADWHTDGRTGVGEFHPAP